MYVGKGLSRVPLRGFRVCFLLLLVFHPPSLHGENEEFEFGVEQEVRSPFNLFTVAPVVDLARGKPAKNYDIFSNLAGTTYLNALRQFSRKNTDAPEIQGKRVFYPDQNWGFSVTPDYGTVEMVFEPMNLGMYRKLQKRLQRDLWDTAAKRNLFPPQYFSAGHVHIGLKNFNEDPRLFLNYVIDFANHSELCFGVLAFDPINALPPLQTKQDKAHFRKVLQDFDEGKITTIAEIQERLFRLPGFGKPRSSLQGALNLKTKYPTIEFRSLRSHPSANHLLAFVEMQAERLAYLRTKDHRIEYAEPTITVDPFELVQRFHGYVSEMGGSQTKFNILLPPDWLLAKRKQSHSKLEYPTESSFFDRCFLLMQSLGI